ncbi:MAG: NADH-quinone oxidoreductase subunit, partial [Microvirga sp.]|nr:NADH-quinone oxidoreductase subunit [Microvirga sp.]MDF2973552.1 NADH-quinone oxidoreductase subunit [Microvirga sp.]
MSAELQALSDHIASSLGAAVVDRAIAFDELTIVARREEIVQVVTFLR